MNAIEEQVLDCFPSGSYALSALLRLVDITESEQVPTAAVECRIPARRAQLFTPTEDSIRRPRPSQSGSGCLGR